MRGFDKQLEGKCLLMSAQGESDAFKLINLSNIQTAPSSTSRAELVPATTLIKDSLRIRVKEDRSVRFFECCHEPEIRNTAEPFKPVKHERAFHGSVLKSMITNSMPGRSPTQF
jgi:hypothetical protein